MTFKEERQEAVRYWEIVENVYNDFRGTDYSQIENQINEECQKHRIPTVDKELEIFFADLMCTNDENKFEQDDECVF